MRESGRAIRVMVVEDHDLVRAAIADTLRSTGLVVVAEAGTSEEALARLDDAQPDVVLVDIDLPGMNGIALLRELVARAPRCTTLMLTAALDEDYVLTAMRAGAAGYLTKNLSPQALGRAVLGATEGELSMPRRMAAKLVQELLRSERRRASTVPSRDGVLSVREREVLALVSAGLTDRAIGERLGISTRTVGNHLGSILAKLGVHSRAAAARAWKTGALEGQLDPVGADDAPVPGSGTGAA